MRSGLDVRLGVLTPQIVRRPPDVASLAAAEEAIDLADAYGLADGFPLDESQRFTLRVAMGERADGSWAASTVGDFEPRQSGKNDAVAARELYGLISMGERLIIHTAHEFPTANESFIRFAALFDNWDDLRRRVRRIFYGSGAQSVEFKSGQRILYKTRTGGSGRGFAKADLVVYDEAQHLKSAHVAASGPARLVNPNAQAWYLGSGGFAWSENSWRLRRRALTGEGSPRFAYVEHTAEKLSVVDGRIVSERPKDLFDRDVWASAHPAYGHRITDESLLGLYDELGPDDFARECLCIWEPEPDSGSVFPAGVWQAVRDRDVVLEGGVVLGVDIDPERTHSSIVAADAAGRVEVIEYRAGTGWVAARTAELQTRWEAPVVVHSSGPAKSLLPELDAAGVTAEKVTDLSAACAAFYDRVLEGRIAVRTSADLDVAVAGAQRKVTGDTWQWARRTSTVDLSPLVAATLAVWMASQPDAAALTFAY